MLLTQPSLSYTAEIGKAQHIATEAQAAASAVINAAEAIDQQSDLLLAELKSEHLRSITEQTSLLQQASHQQSADAQALIRQEVAGLRQGAETAAKALQQVLEEQPRILATITAQHEQAGGSQTDLLRETIQHAATSLNEQFTARMHELQQGKTDFETAIGKQLDVFTSIADRLQVISASLTAFRDAMNAAKFTDRLESLAAQQERLLSLSEAHQTALLERLAGLDSLQQQQGELMTSKLAALKSQNTLLQVLIIGGTIALAALHFIK
jgi:type I site-specific restriction endonuclease